MMQRKAQLVGMGEMRRVEGWGMGKGGVQRV